MSRIDLTQSRGDSARNPLKLFLAERLRMHQLELLALFVLTHGEALLRHGICGRAANPIEGFQFVTLPG